MLRVKDYTYMVTDERKGSIREFLHTPYLLKHVV